MDADIIRQKGKKGTQLIILPDPDISEPGTESESDIAPEQNEPSIDSSTDEESPESHSDDEMESILLAQLAPHLKAIHFKWQKEEIAELETPFLLQFSDPPDPEFTPIQYFEEFFSHELISLITSNTEIYAKQQNRQNFSISDDEMRKFLGVILLMGIVHMPDMRMYWHEGSRYAPIADLFSRDRFFEIISNLHFNDNNKIIINRNDPEYDRMFKIRPILESVRRACLKIDIEERNSID